jgi:hypothetical protein
MKTPKGYFDYILSGWPDVVPALQTFQGQVEDLIYGSRAKRQTTNQAQTTNSLSGGILSDLTWTVVNGTVYGFTILLRITDPAGEGMQIDLAGGTVTITDCWISYYGFDNAPGTMMAHPTSLATVVAVDQFAGPALIEIKGSFAATNSGTLIPRFAQKNHSAGTLTVLKGSSIVVRELTT